MKPSRLALIALLACAPVAEASNPLSKVIDLMSELEAKVKNEGEVELKAYKEYVEFCDDASKNKQFEIRTLTSDKEKLEAVIGRSTADAAASEDKIAGLAASIATAEAELRDATAIREKEHADFSAAEAELADSIDALARASAIISREMAKNPALMQVDTSNVQRLVQSFGAVIDAAGFAFTSGDKQKLLSLVQSRDGDEDRAEADEAALGAPAAAVYKTHSTGILDVLEDLREKAEAELDGLRKAETNAQHNFNKLRQSLEDQRAADNHDMAEEKDSLAASKEARASAEGDLSRTTANLADAEGALATAQSTCMSVAADHEATVRGRTEELTAIATAKKILSETSSGAVDKTYSLLQVAAASKLRTRTDLASAEVVDQIRRLAQEHHSAALAQLASKITAVMRLGVSAGGDPFVKVRGLIQDLINNLEKEAAAEASEKAYCDENMAKTEAKQSDLEDTIAKLTAKIDSLAAASAALKKGVKDLQAELAALAKMQAEMDKARADQNAAYREAKADLELGLSGVQRATETLQAYYGSASLLQQPPKPELHSKASGAGGSILDILSVVASDFSKELAARESEEADQEAAYEKQTQENKVTKTMKDQDAKYKTKDFTSKDKEVAELTADRETESTELAAVNSFYAKLKDRCIAVPEPYAERKRRREAEIAGLKDALSVLENETVLVQRRAHSGVLRR